PWSRSSGSSRSPFSAGASSTHTDRPSTSTIRPRDSHSSTASVPASRSDPGTRGTLHAQVLSSGRSEAAPPGSVDQLGHIGVAVDAMHDGSCAIVTYTGVPPGAHAPYAQMSLFDPDTAIVTTDPSCPTETVCGSFDASLPVTHV